MHREAYAFVQKVVAHHPVAGRAVLEIGSYNVNGSVRRLFEAAASYTGIDVREGPGVDQAIRAQDYTSDPPVDIVVCCEVMEHDPDPAGIIACAERSLKPNGLLILTMAAPERAPHSCDGHAALPEGEHYANISPDQLRTWLRLGGWVAIHMEHYLLRGDLYAIAERPTPPTPEAEESELAADVLVLSRSGAPSFPISTEEPSDAT